MVNLCKKLKSRYSRFNNNEEREKFLNLYKLEFKDEKYVMKNALHFTIIIIIIIIILLLVHWYLPTQPTRHIHPQLEGYS